MLGLVVACVSPRGGWDVSALIAKDPSIAEIAGQRLGDLLPFPALDGDRIALVACRFATPTVLRVAVRGSQWPAEWGETALEAMGRSVSGLALDLDADHALIAIAEVKPEIEIVMIEAVGGAGPRGLGDTLSECDVTPRNRPIDRGRRMAALSEPDNEVRGVLLGAEIRMRRAQRNAKGLVQDARAEEWVGALLHELAHAFGFGGHVAVGNSILVREESRVRAAGRRALAGEPIRVPSLEALYLIEPGQRLGVRPVRSKDLVWLNAISALIEEDARQARTAPRILSSVGDREARLVWRDGEGRQFGIRFPYWRRELERGAAITLRPNRVTRERLAGTVHRIELPRLFLNRRVE